MLVVAAATAVAATAVAAVTTTVTLASSLVVWVCFKWLNYLIGALPTFISLMRADTCKQMAGIISCDYIPPQLRPIGQTMSVGRCRQARLQAPGHVTTFLLN